MNRLGHDEFKSWLARHAEADSGRILESGTPQYVNSIGGATNAHDELAWYTRAGRFVTSTFGLGRAMMDGLAAAGTLKFLMSLLPMAQALVLMGLYMFLPLAVFISGFSLRMMFMGAVAIFTVKFWTVMWELAYWLDARIMNAMYPSDELAIDAIRYMAEDGALPYEKKLLLNILMMITFVGFPLIWTSMMAWVGIRVGSEFGNLLNKTDGMGSGMGAAGAKYVAASAQKVGNVAKAAVTGGKSAAIDAAQKAFK